MTSKQWLTVTAKQWQREQADISPVRSMAHLMSSEMVQSCCRAVSWVSVWSVQLMTGPPPLCSGSTYAFLHSSVSSLLMMLLFMMRRSYSSQNDTFSWWCWCQPSMFYLALLRCFLVDGFRWQPLTYAPLGGGGAISSPPSSFLAISSKPMQVSPQNLQCPLSQHFYALC